MTEASQTYRWNTSAAAEAYDEAAPTIHPFYETVQDHILDQLPFGASTPFVVVDLGGGSGRLLERVLARFEAARTILVDQSEPFLALAERRLTRFAPQVRMVRVRLQDDWAGALDEAPDVIVSTSAIHHLEPTEKQSLFAKCYAALRPGGLFINGDEYRPASDAQFLALLEEWSNHMFSAIESGQIGESFRPTVEQWHDRNIQRFGGSKKSGDDCLETAAMQIEYLEQAGFTGCEMVWAKKLWGVAVGRK